MATLTIAPQGLVPVKHLTGAVAGRPKEGTILSTYATTLYRGTPVMQLADGTIGIGTTTKILGSFAGCRYTDSSGRRRISPTWPGGTTATDISCFYYDDPDIVYEIQAATAAGETVTQSQIGAAFTFHATTYAIGTGSSQTGLSTASAIAGAGPLQFIEFARYPDQAAGDTNPRLWCIIMQHQYRANGAAF